MLSKLKEVDSLIPSRYSSSKRRWSSWVRWRWPWSRRWRESRPTWSGSAWTRSRWWTGSAGRFPPVNTRTHPDLLPAMLHDADVYYVKFWLSLYMSGYLIQHNVLYVKDTIYFNSIHRFMVTFYLSILFQQQRWKICVYYAVLCHHLKLKELNYINVALDSSDPEVTFWSQAGIFSSMIRQPGRAPPPAWGCEELGLFQLLLRSAGCFPGLQHLLVRLQRWCEELEANLHLLHRSRENENPQ